MRRLLFTGILLLAFHSYVLAQPFMTYKGVLRNPVGIVMASQHFGLKIKLYEDSATGLLAWEETHDPTTAANGRFEVSIGQGIPGSGFYSNFNLIPWSQHIYFMRVEVDFALTGTYSPYASNRLLSVPYAQHSRTADVPYRLHELNDVNITSLNAGQVLKWNGISWINTQDNDSDTAAYAPNALLAGQSDTAQYVVYFPVDTVAYVVNTNLSNYVTHANNAANAAYAPTADTAQYAITVPAVTWLLNGNSLGAGPSTLLGSTDSIDVGLGTNQHLRLRFSKTGDVSNNGVFHDGMFYLQHNSLFLHTLTGSGTMQMSGAGTRWMYMPYNGSFRAGTVTGTLWDSVNIKPYSFAFGQNCNSGSYSFTVGKNNTASGDNAMVFGRASIASALGVGGNGTSFCVGDSSLATGIRTVVLGRQCQAGNSTAIAMGYKSRAMANVSTVIGNNASTTTGLYSMVLGSYVNGSNRQACFLYGDRSTTTIMIPTANYQFRIRAAGGIYFYSDPLLTSGVSLLPGAGSWSTLSDVSRKENIEVVNNETILQGIAQLKVKSWSYRSQQGNIRHIGPTAQQFKKIFGVGESKRLLSMVDADGVIMAGILGIDERHQRFLQQYHTTTTNLRELQEGYSDLEERLQKIENTIQKK